MGVKKAKPKAKATKGVVGKVKSALGAIKGGGSRATGRRRRMTVTQLQNRILILKLKKRLNRLKYGGR